MKYNFDEIIERRGTCSYKWDSAPESGILPMWVADMDFRAAQPIVDAVKRRASLGVYGYTRVPDSYYSAVVNWFARRHQWTMDKEWIIYTSGVVPALSAVIKALTVPGDKVLVQTPVYNCFFSSIRNNGCEVLSSPLKYENSTYHIDFEDFERKASDPSVKIFLLCNPHNPIGCAWKKDELTEIARLAEKHGTIILTDDVYSGLLFPGAEYTPIASLSKEISYRTITLCSTSKCYNTTGLKHAYAIIENPEMFKTYSESLDRQDLGYGMNIMGMAAVIAAYGECDEWLHSLMEEISRKHRFVTDFINENIPALSVTESNASYFAWIDMRSLGMNAKEIAYRLETEEHMVFENGADLGKGGAGFIRMNLATSDMNIERGMERLKAFSGRHLR